MLTNHDIGQQNLMPKFNGNLWLTLTFIVNKFTHSFCCLLYTSSKKEDIGDCKKRGKIIISRFLDAILSESKM